MFATATATEKKHDKKSKQKVKRKLLHNLQYLWCGANKKKTPSELQIIGRMIIGCAIFFVY
jgi:hypothetical protein